MKKLLILIFTLKTMFFCCAQPPKNPSRYIYWKNVIAEEIDSLKLLSLPENCIEGEWSIKTNKKINSMSDLSKIEFKKIKKKAARNYGKIVYIDVTQTVETGEIGNSVYFVWFSCIQNN